VGPLRSPLRKPLRDNAASASQATLERRVGRTIREDVRLTSQREHFDRLVPITRAILDPLDLRVRNEFLTIHFQKAEHRSPVLLPLPKWEFGPGSTKLISLLHSESHSFVTFVQKLWLLFISVNDEVVDVKPRPILVVLAHSLFEAELAHPAPKVATGVVVMRSLDLVS
jgi:hypothetical protein